MNSEEYVPMTMPHSMAIEKPRSTSPPNSSSDSTARVVVLTVRMVRDSVSLRLLLMSVRKSIVLYFRIVSRMRS